MSTATTTENLDIVGQKYSRHSFGEVTAFDGVYYTIKNEAGKEWQIAKEIFDDEFKLSHQYEDTTLMNRTSIIDVFKQSARTVMTVTFRKKPKNSDLVDYVAALCDHGNGLPEELQTAKGEFSRRKLASKLAEFTAGEQRTMTGRHVNVQDDNGRFNFYEVGVGNRLIDPRTIESIIVDGRKYIVQ